jgi:AraC-like DNA-binding protein
MNPGRESHSLPAVHALHIAELVARWGVSRDRLLDGTGVTAADLEQPEGRLSLATVEDVVERARQLTGEPALGLFLGMQMRISAHGYLGFAAMTAASVREAIEVGIRYTPTRTTALRLLLEVDGEEASLVVEELADLGRARDVIILALLVGIWQIGQALTGQELRGTADVGLPAPPWVRRFEKLMPQVRFGRARHRLMFDARLLELPLMMADAAAMKLARDQCERQLDAVASEAGLRGRVRTELATLGTGFRSLETVAARLHVSPRTLKRRLAAEGTGFSELLEQERHARAVQLLSQAEPSLEEVASRLGYSDLANFTRAFRRWTGHPPGAFRRQALAAATAEDKPR